MSGSDIQGAIYAVMATALAGSEKLAIADVWFNDSLDTAPKDRNFAIIRMTNWNVLGGRGQAMRRNFDIYVHAPRRGKLDHTDLRNLLRLRIIPTFLGAVQVAGTDGILTSCDFKALSADLTDEGYQTITNYASFEAGVR